MPRHDQLEGLHMTDDEAHSEGGQTANKNARGRRRATYAPQIKMQVPRWLQRARIDFDQDARRRRTRNWRTDPSTGRPCVGARTIHVDANAADTRRPIRVDLPGRPPRCAATAVEARGIVEADFAREEDAKLAARRAVLTRRAH